MTCGNGEPCSLCDSTPWHKWDKEPAYEGHGNLTDDLRLKRGSEKPHVMLCSGCLERVMPIFQLRGEKERNEQSEA